MAHLKLLAPLVISLGTCSARPQPPAPEQPPADAPAALAPAGDPPTRAPERDCSDAACWQARADEAARRGALDLAASMRGRAFAAAPGAAAFDAWLDALLALPELRRAHAAVADARALALADPALRAAIDARAAALPPIPPALSLAAPPSDRARAGFEALVAGRTDDALAALQGAPDPTALAVAAEQLALRGDPLAAATLRSRARARLRDAGAALSLIPVESWHTVEATWLGDQIVLARFVNGIDDFMIRLGALELWRLPPGPGGPARRLFLPATIDALAPVDDGRTLAYAAAGQVVLLDMPTGTTLRRLDVAPGARITDMLAVGAGDSLHLLVTTGAETTLWTGAGKRLDRFTLAGTTPTITRVYTGEGAYHDNILEDSPTWAAALAMTPDAARVAIGGSDAKVRVFDRARGTTRVLSFPWTYTEHRHMGGNPDLNPPLALRFTDGGARLVAVHVHGERLVWDTRSGAALRRDDGACTPDEAEAIANRFVSPGAPRISATADHFRACALATLGAIDRDGATIVTASSGTARIRGVDGRAIATLTAEQLPEQHIALSADGALAMASLYGRVDTWRPGQAAITPALPAAQSGPIDPEISANGRFLRFDVRPAAFAWDLLARRPLATGTSPGETLLALSDDGRHAAIHTRDAVEVRDLRTRAALVRLPAHPSPSAARARFTAAGLLLDLDRQSGRSIAFIRLPDGALRSIDPPPTDAQLVPGPDGRWLVALRPYGTSELHDLDAAGAPQVLGPDLRAAAFARDGGALAWLVNDPPDKPRVRALHRRLGPSAAPPAALELAGWPAAVALDDDGSDVFILLESGELHRWRPATGEHTSVKHLEISGARHVQAVPGGKTLLLTAYDQITVLADAPGFPVLATLLPLLTGGWLAHSPAGAFDGSDDAPRHLLTRAAAGADALLLDGALGWDGALVPGLYARALAGEAVAAPVP